MTALEETRTELDPTTVEAFGTRMGGMLSEACTALLTSLGHQAGLFDALAQTGVTTSEGWPGTPGSTSATSGSGSTA